MVGTTPGSALCDLYRIDHVGTSGSLAMMNIQRRIFNLSEDVITGAYAPVTRTKSGAWVLTANYNAEPVTGTACIDTLAGIVLSDLDVETAPSYALCIDAYGCLVKVEVGDCP